MPTDLYLDTARFGRMTPRARTALDDFGRLSAVEGGSLRLLDVLRGAPGRDIVRDWSGVGGLKDSVRSLLNTPTDVPVYLAGRSAPLVRVVVRAILRSCERILCTDLEWPRYRTLLCEEARRVGREVVCVPARDAVLRDGTPSAELVRFLTGAYRSNHCDGLFLSDVTFEGIRLPVAEIVRELGPHRPPRFVAVDGAQAVGHVHCDLAAFPCDAYLAGCHKWLAAGQTMGFAVCPLPRSQGLIAALFQEMIASGEIDDPLLLLLLELDGELPWQAGDTADVSCLFSGSAALAAARTSSRTAGERRSLAAENASLIRRVARSSGWRSFPVDPRLETNILLLERAGDANDDATPDNVRRRFQERGVALTVYAGGILRVSQPAIPLTRRRLAPLRGSLRDLAGVFV